MRDPMFLILSTLRNLLQRLSSIVSFVFVNYFPSTTPEDTNDLGLKPLGK